LILPLTASAVVIAGALTAVPAAAAPHAVGATSASAQAASTKSESVIVEGLPGQLPRLTAKISQLGGHVQRRLPLINGVTARLSASAVVALSHTPGVRDITVNSRIRFASVDPTLGFDPVNDTGGLPAITNMIGARASWAAGYTGKGIDVALIDSGVSPVPGLNSGNVVNGPDLSFDSQNPSLSDLDGYGHGTHMASIIVGRDTPGSASSYVNGSGFTGVAPDARLISLKVGAADGSADVSQVIAAINWVTQHATDKGYNIRVLNLSFGTDSIQPYKIDPLAYAAEMAWRKGVVVVAAGGNDGNTAATLSDPANDPYLLAVGADDPNGTLDPADDTVPDFASHGTGSRHVDLVAPGVHVLGLRDPNSAVDQAYPSAEVGTRFFRGSGTSQAAAVTSGAVALLLQRYPSFTPDQVKRQLMNTATAFSTSSTFRGNGLINVRAAEIAPANSSTQSKTDYGTGTGSLDAARGDARVSDGTSVLTGEKDIFGRLWQASTWSALASKGTAWNGGTWNGGPWSGNGWTGFSWTTPTWAGVPWTAPTWGGVTWTGHSWTGHSWTGSGWDGHSWTDYSWSGHSWTNSGWDGHSWTDSTWADSTWASDSWN
jgi:serine protease AprX